MNGISTTEESLQFSKIDLSGLTDVVAIETNTLNELEARSDAVFLKGKGEKSGLFDVVNSRKHKSPFLAKIRRKAYLPLAPSAHETISMLFEEEAYDMKPKTPGITGGLFWPIANIFHFYEGIFNLNRVKHPQRVNWSFGGRKGRLNL